MLSTKPALDFDRVPQFEKNRLKRAKFLVRIIAGNTDKERNQYMVSGSISSLIKSLLFKPERSEHCLVLCGPL